MRKFESEVQNIKYKVLKEIAAKAIEGTFEKERYKIPKIISPGPASKIRCCVYKERAIVEERIEYAVCGIDKENKNIVEVIGIACDECPAKRFTITEACRGCLAHRCIQVCPKNAIDIYDGRAKINQDKCIECGKCKDVCPFNAISDVMRPCKKACGSKAIEMDEQKRAVINREKCTSCGSCVYQCPFGAITDRSEIVEIIKRLEEAKNGNGKNVYAMIAPAISSQFNAKIGQVVNAIRNMGFKDVIEVALGADIVARDEAFEFAEKVGKGSQKALMSSCCPAFVEHVKKNYPELVGMTSSMVSPMVAISKFIKKTDSEAMTVFIGPCIAKKSEAIEDDINGVVDYVMTFEELESMIDAYEIDIENCEEALLDNASYFGRIFARSGGLADAVKEVMEEYKIETELKAVVCDGIEECDRALKMLKFGKLEGNFIEGMACKGGCIGGAASLTHGPKDKNEVNKYASGALEKKITSSLRIVDTDNIDFHRHR